MWFSWINNRLLKRTKLCYGYAHSLNYGWRAYKLACSRFNGFLKYYWEPKAANASTGM